MSRHDVTILVVDDEPASVRYLQNELQDAGYGTILYAEDGQQAWEILQLRHDSIDLLLLDRFMPKLDGLSLLRHMKQQPQTAQIPVIMQTAATDEAQKHESLKAGAYYYLTKPYNRETLLTVIDAAMRDLQFSRKMQQDITRFAHSIHLLKECHFSAKSLEDATYLGGFLANFFPDPDRVVVGLTELLINAVEHGNLDISYLEKSELLHENGWKEEIERRLKLPQYRQKSVDIQITRSEEDVCIRIHDEGNGFQWQRFLKMDPARAAHPHGRGIAIAKTVSFDQLQFNDKGNEVIASCQLQAQQPLAIEA